MKINTDSNGKNILEEIRNSHLSIDGFANKINKLYTTLSGLRGSNDLTKLQENNYSKEYLLELINEIDSIEELEGQELNRYVFLVCEYLSEIKEENPIKAEKIYSFLKKISKTNSGLNFARDTIIIQNEVLKYFYSGNYVKISENFESYIKFTNDILNGFEQDNTEINAEKIIKLDLLTFLVINLSLCVFDENTHKKIIELSEKLSIILETSGLLRHFILIKQSIFKSELNKKIEPQIIENIEKQISIIDETDYKVNLQKITSQEKYQFLILKLDVIIEGEGDNSEIESLIKKIESQEKEDFDLKIHFEYLKALYYIKKGNNTKNTVEETKDKTGDIIAGKGIQEKDETRKGIQMLEKIIDDNLTIENKLFLFETVILLIETEEDINKRKEYFFKAWKYVKKHFGEKSNFYMDELLEIGKILFPKFDEERLNLEFELYILKKNEKEYKLVTFKQLEEDASYEDLSELLKAHFGVDELFIYELSGEDIRYSSGFNEGIGGIEGDCMLLQEEVQSQLNDKSWSKIKLTENSIPAILNLDYFSETLVGKIFKIGKHKQIFVCLSKGPKNNTCLSKNQLEKIELLYLRKRLSDDIANADSERKIKIEKLYEELQKLMSTIKKLTSGTFHDINGLLSVIAGNNMFIEMDIDDYKNAKITKEELLNLIKGRVLEIEDTIKQLKLLSKEGKMILESGGGYILAKNNCEINSIITDVCKGSETLIAMSGKEIKIIFDNNEIINAYLDIGKIKQVINNIISNSIKFIENSGIIKISTGVEYGKLYINIEDNGIGMEKGDLKKIFRYATQVGTVIKNREGTGIGLYNCMNLIKAHDGKIHAYSEGKGKGSKFLVELKAVGTVLDI